MTLVRVSAVAPPRADAGREASRATRVRRKRRGMASSVWLLLVAVLFAAFGTVRGVVASLESKGRLAAVADYDDDEILVQGGEQHSIREYREQIERDVLLAFLVDYVLAGIMLVLFVWARSSPLPALVTALIAYLCSIGVLWARDRASLGEDLVVKVVFVAVFLAGIHGARGGRWIGRKLS